MRFREQRERRRRADELHTLASSALAARCLDEAERLLRKSLELVSEEPGVWFDLGLIYKWQKRWEQSFECNHRAFLMNSRDQATCWNLGIAATVLRRWDIARTSWRSCGLPMAEGDDPIVMPMGPMPVRLNPDGQSEVVWAECIDPARGIIKQIPLPESGYGFQDTVLRDGEPTGTRFVDAKPVAVFDVLELWEPSVYSTYVIRANMPDRSMAERLSALCEQHERIEMADWAESTVALHPHCSRGSVDTEHRPVVTEWVPDRRIGIAAVNRAEAEQLIQRWCSETGAVITDFSCALSR